MCFDIFRPLTFHDLFLTDKKLDTKSIFTPKIFCIRYKFNYLKFYKLLQLLTFFCGPERTRTADLCNANAVFYLLNYWPFGLMPAGLRVNPANCKVFTLSLLGIRRSGPYRIRTGDLPDAIGTLQPTELTAQKISFNSNSILSPIPATWYWDHPIGSIFGQLNSVAIIGSCQITIPFAFND